MPKKKLKSKSKLKKSKSKSKSKEELAEVGKIPNSKMVKQMASESLSPTASSLSTRDKLSSALFDAELRSQRRFMRGKITTRAYEQLTPQEIRDLKLVFDSFDADKNGAIDARELRKAMKALGFRLTRESLNEMIEHLDSDKSGHIEFDEFLEFVISKQGDGRDTHTEIMQGFKMFVTEKSGKITTDSLKQASRMCGLKLNDQEIKEMVEEADNNGDNEIDAEEFLSIMLRTNLFN